LLIGRLRHLLWWSRDIFSLRRIKNYTGLKRKFYKFLKSVLFVEGD